MKVEQNREFQPITITLETEFEARVLQTLVGNVEDIGKFSAIADEIFENLSNLGIDHFGGDYKAFYSDQVNLES